MGAQTEDFSQCRGAAVVTGGSGALGGAICQLLATRGSNVAFSYRTRRAAADEVIRAASAGSAREVVAWPADLAQEDSALAFAHQVLERFGSVHTLVHAAGPHVTQVHLSKVAPKQFQWHLTAEAAGFFNIVAPLLASLRAAQGSIVAVTTVAIRRFPIRDGLSSSPKAAVEALVRALAAEEGRFGVRANCVAPGILRDGMTNHLITNGELHERDLEAARARIPLERFGTAEDIAEAVCFLASPRAAYITGQTLDIDGGYAL